MKKGIPFLVISLIIFMLAVTTAINDFSKSVSTVTSVGRFGGVYNRGDNREFNVKSDAELKFKIYSTVEKGDLTFSIVSPDNKVVYKKEGKSFYDIQRIPVTEGTWYFKIETEYAENGIYFLKAQIKNDK